MWKIGEVFILHLHLHQSMRFFDFDTSDATLELIGVFDQGDVAAQVTLYRKDQS